MTPHLHKGRAAGPEFSVELDWMGLGALKGLTPPPWLFCSEATALARVPGRPTVPSLGGRGLCSAPLTTSRETANKMCAHKGFKKAGQSCFPKSNTQMQAVSQ